MAQSTMVSIEPLDGFNGDLIRPEVAIQLGVRFTNNSGIYITGSTNGFALFTHRNQQYTNNFGYPSSGPWLRLTGAVTPDMYDAGFFTGGYSVDGIGRDTLKLYGGALFKAGIPDGFDETVAIITVNQLVPRDTFCVDSSWAPPGSSWLWAGTGEPAWPGPYCWEVGCCTINEADVDFDGDVDMHDLNMMVEYVFPPHTPLYPPGDCEGMGNVDGLTTLGSKVTVNDVIYLVEYLMTGSPTPAACPGN